MFYRSHINNKNFKNTNFESIVIVGAMVVARYDVFEAGFNNFDETINFGKRAIGGEKSLYEICTLAVLRSSEDIVVSIHALILAREIFNRTILIL